jgi:hypothetical protein
MEMSVKRMAATSAFKSWLINSFMVSVSKVVNVFDDDFAAFKSPVCVKLYCG